jgi:hypothetical protein
MRNKRRQGNMTPQKVDNHTVEDFVGSEGDESLVSEVRKMIRMFNELKENIQKQLNESQENRNKNLKTQKQQNELRGFQQNLN